MEKGGHGHRVANKTDFLDSLLKGVRVWRRSHLESTAVRSCVGVAGNSTESKPGKERCRETDNRHVNVYHRMTYKLIHYFLSS